MARTCPKCGNPVPRPDADPDSAQQDCPTCGAPLDAEIDPTPAAPRPGQVPPARSDAFDRIKHFIQTAQPPSGQVARPFSLSVHVDLARCALGTRLWIPGTILTTGGLLLGLLFFYIGTQVDRVAALALGTLAAAAVLWTVALNALAVAKTLDLRMGTATPSPDGRRPRTVPRAGFGQSLRKLMEKDSPLVRSVTRWVSAGLLGCWLLGLVVLACSVVGLAGQIGRALMGAFLGVQVLLMAAGFVWLVFVCQILAVHPLFIHQRTRSDANLFKPVLRLLRSPPAGLDAELFNLSCGIVVMLLLGALALAAAYAVVLILDAAVLEHGLMQVLSASPLARFSKYGLAAEPSLGLQAAGILATVSLSAVLGLLLSAVACYWGTAAYALGARSAFRRHIEDLLR